MQRLIGLLLLIFIPLATMAQTDYPVHDDFRAACRITAPLGRGVLGIGNAFLAAMPKGMRTESMALFSDTPVWNSKLNAKMWEYYLQGATEESLLDIDNNELQDLPATYVETAEFDCLRDEGNAFATLLQRAGVATRLIETKGTMHGFDMAQRSGITERQIAERCKWLGEW